MAFLVAVCIQAVADRGLQAPHGFRISVLSVRKAATKESHVTVKVVLMIQLLEHCNTGKDGNKDELSEMPKAGPIA